MEVPFGFMDMCLCSLLFIFLLVAEQSLWMHIPSGTDVFFVLLSTWKFSHNEFETWEINSVGFLWLVSWSVKKILHFLSRVIWIQRSFRGRGLNRLALSGKILFWICGMEYYCCFKHHCLKQAIANYKLETSSSFVKIALLYKLYSRKTFRYLTMCHSQCSLQVGFQLLQCLFIAPLLRKMPKQWWVEMCEKSESQCRRLRSDGEHCYKDKGIKYTLKILYSFL